MVGRIFPLTPNQAQGNKYRKPVPQKPARSLGNKNAPTQKPREVAQRPMSTFEQLKTAGWTPRLLLDPQDPWILRERRLGMQKIMTTAAFDSKTGTPINDREQVLVWSKQIDA